MIKVVMLEDEDEQAKRLVEYLNRYADEQNRQPFIIERYAQAFLLLDRYTCDADVLLLDIRVPDMLGMEVARRIRIKDSRVVIMFVTGLSQYAIEGYSVGALDYILKPVSYASFSAKLDRALRIISHETAGKQLVLRTQGGQIRLSASEIRYIEIMDHNIYIHVMDGREIRQWGTLAKFERLLQQDNFIRCHSCYLVNLKYVQEVRGDDIIVAGKNLAVSKPRRKAFLQAFAQYKGGSR